MNKITQFYILISLFCFYACNSESKGTDSENPNEQTTEEKIVNKTNEIQKIQNLPNDPNASIFLPTIERFYTEICLKNAIPYAILNNEGFYVLDIETHQKRLEKTHLFTANFINNEKEVFAECAEVLLAEPLTDEDVEGTIEMLGPNPCKFLNSAYYFQAQEFPDTFRLMNSVISEDTGDAELHYYSEFEEGHTSWDDLIYLKIDFVKKDGKWLIDRVRKVVRE